MRTSATSSVINRNAATALSIRVTERLRDRYLVADRIPGQSGVQLPAGPAQPARKHPGNEGSTDRHQAERSGFLASVKEYSPAASEGCLQATEETMRFRRGLPAGWVPAHDVRQPVRQGQSVKENNGKTTVSRTVSADNPMAGTA